MGNVTKIIFGAVSSVKIGAYGTVKGSCVDLGYTKGGVFAEFPREYYNIDVDQEQGDIDVKVVKRGMVVRFAIAQAQLENMRYALDLPASALASNVLKNGTQDEQKMTIFIDGNAPDTGTRELWIPSCVCINGGGHSYVKDGETVTELEFKVIFDTAQVDGEELGKITDSGVDTTPPTVALSSPVDGGTVTKDTKETVVWDITEAGNPMDQNSLIYGVNFLIINTTTPASASLVAGSISYNASTKQVTFTPDANWNASDTFQVIVQGIRDLAGNVLATPKIEQFSVTA